jgi:hypothetical protein
MNVLFSLPTLLSVLSLNMISCLQANVRTTQLSCFVGGLHFPIQNCLSDFFFFFSIELWKNGKITMDVLFPSLI